MAKPKQKTTEKTFTVRLPHDLCRKVRIAAAVKGVKVYEFTRLALEKAVAA